MTKKQLDELISACTRMMVGIKEKSTEDCDWYEGIEYDGADEAEKILNELKKEDLSCLTK